MLLSKTRVKLIVRLRFELMHDLRRRYKHLSYVRIGQLMGGMDHTSVLHGIRRHLELSVAQNPIDDIIQETERH